MLAAYGGLFAGLLTLDLGIKQHIEDTFDKRQEEDTVLKHVVLRKVYNKGFMLDTLDQYPKLIRGSSAAAAVLLIFSNVRLFLKRGKWLEKLGMVFVSAGAASNIYDRLARGKVIDYIGFKSRNTFLATITANLADFYVVIGAVIVQTARIFKKK